MLKYILTAIFLLLIWAAFLILRLPPWIPFLASVGLIGLLGLLVGGRALRAGRAAARIEGALNRQADDDASNLRPEQASEIRALQVEFNRSIQALKTSRLGRGGKNALAALPWYVIIGPPGAGKTTALRNSGLKFPNLAGSGRGGGIRGVGGTRNCEWWLTNDAILLDTAGRYTTEEDDREEWFAFLDMLKKARPSRPVNGIIAAISVADLATASLDEVADRARQIRERIDELMDRVRIVVPVYVLLTKCDLVSGFAETFGDLRKKERGQIWGFTVPLADADLDPGELFQDHFDELVSVLEQRAPERMVEARNPETRERVYEFPQQFAAMRDNLTEFVTQISAENVYQATPILRGVYFTSGTQEGRPFDRVMSRMADAFGVRQRVQSDAAATEAKSYFLFDLMSEVVFPDRDVAFRNKKGMRRAGIIRWSIAGACLALAGTVLALGATSYVGNRQLIASTLGVVQAAGQLTAGSEPSLDDIEPLGKKVAELLEYEKNGPPITLRFGMYQGGKLYTAVRGSYAAAIRKTIFEPALAQDIDDLNDFASRYRTSGAAPDAKDYVRYFDKLKLHLLLSRPREPGEPVVGATEQAWILDTLMARRGRGVAKKGDPAIEPMSIFLRLLASEPTLAIARADEVVKQVRQVMRRAHLEQFILDKMMADLNREDLSVGLPELVGYGVTTLESSARIRGAFTRKAWEKKVRVRLAKAGEPEDRWVLGGEQETPEAGKNAEDQLVLLRTQYFKQYRDEWRRFVESIRLKPASSGPEALAMLQELTENKPVAVLAAEVARNTHLEELSAEITSRVNGLGSKMRQKLGMESAEPTPAAAQKPVDDRVVTAEDVEAYFAELVKFAVAQKDESGGKKPPPLDLFQEQLEYVRDDLKTYLDGEGKEPAPVENRLKVARTKLDALLPAAGARWRPRFASLLTPMLELTTDAVRGVGGGAANGRWCSEVAQPYAEVIGKRYPFAKSSSDEVQLANFTQYYAPGAGKIWKFFDSALQAKIAKVDDRFEQKEKSGIYSAGLLTFLSRSQAITAAMFPAGAPQPSVRFAIQIAGAPGVAETALEVDGQKVTYRNGPLEWKNIHWPGDGQKTGAVLRVKGAGIDETIPAEGEWGLFRLLDQAAIKPEGPPPAFAAVWTLKGKAVEVKIVFKPGQRENPFIDPKDTSPHPQIFHVLRAKDAVPPASIAKGGKCE